MICVKCGAQIEKSECTLLQCSNDLHVPLKKCECDICDCYHKTPAQVCNKCIRGEHKGEI